VTDYCRLNGMTPDEYTNQELMLDVGDSHALYIHDWGNKDAKTPIIHLHGGPGGGTGDKHKQRFDPNKQRVFFYDQRGAGRSTPYGLLENNTTDDLVEDIEKIADHFNLKSFILFGSSWGSTLALAYTLEHPERVATLVIDATWTLSRQEVLYDQNGLYRTHFPDVWDRLVSQTPDEHKADPVPYHLGRINGSDETEAAESARIYMDTQFALLKLDDRFTPSSPEDYDPVPAKIAAHYAKHAAFFPEDRYLLNNASKINVKTYIVQGRYDFLCPPITAYELDKAMPNSSLIWTQAGHANDRNSYEVIKTLLLQASQV
jgi:proline iminopeptidase